MTPTLALATTTATCPTCSGPMCPEQRRNALSRRQPGVYICTPCGMDEAMADMIATSAAPAVPVENAEDEARADMVRAQVGDDLADEYPSVAAFFRTYGDRVSAQVVDAMAREHGHANWAQFIEGIDDEPEARADGSMWTVDVLLALGY